MQIKYFGTDGIRGRSNEDFITPENMLKLARSIVVSMKLDNANYQNHSKELRQKPKVIIGKDPRISSDMLEYSLASSFVSMGIDVILIGYVPTPCVSMIVKLTNADIGVMVSASHNPYHDNGIKIFDSNGYKLTKEKELEIEQLFDKDLSKYYAKCEDLGKISYEHDLQNKYISYLTKNIDIDTNLFKMKIILDVANGATYEIASKIFQSLNMDVTIVNNNPNGININDNCGVNNFDNLKKQILKDKADLAIAFDGDGDRIIILDNKANIINGDQIIALIANYQKENNLLTSEYIVTTIMSNMGLEKYLNSIDLKLIRTQVGDKNVALGMKQYNASLGGEQSGHIIIGENESTGDGIKVALLILQILSNYKQKNQVDGSLDTSTIFNLFKPAGQYHYNIEYDRKFFGKNIISDDKLNQIHDNIIKLYSKNDLNFRIILRLSGTESIIRLMIESDDDIKYINQIKDNIWQQISKLL